MALPLDWVLKALIGKLACLATGLVTNGSNLLLAACFGEQCSLSKIGSALEEFAHRRANNFLHTRKGYPCVLPGSTILPRYLTQDRIKLMLINARSSLNLDRNSLKEKVLHYSKFYLKKIKYGKSKGMQEKVSWVNDVERKTCHSGSLLSNTWQAS